MVSRRKAAAPAAVESSVDGLAPEQLVGGPERRGYCVCFGTFTTRDPNRELCDECLAEAEVDDARVAAIRPDGEVETLVDPEIEQAPEVCEQQVRDALAVNADTLRRLRWKKYRDPAWTFVAELRRWPYWAQLDCAYDAAEQLDGRHGGIFARIIGELRPPFGYAASDVDSIKDRFPEAWAGGWCHALGVTHSRAKQSSKAQWRDPLECFLTDWSQQRDSFLEMPIEDAIRASRAPAYQDPSVFGPELAKPMRAPFRRFLAVALELAAAGGGVAFLPTRQLAARLGTDHKAIGAWRNEAVNRGFLELVAPAIPKKRAATYRWVGR